MKLQDYVICRYVFVSDIGNYTTTMPNSHRIVSRTYDLS